MEAQYEWQLKPVPTEAELQTIIKDNPLPKAAAQLLWQRGLRDAEQINNFMNPNVGQLHDPYALHDMQKAIDRIQAAIVNGEKITIYGDYDADGITSTTLMKETLDDLGAAVEVYVPNRFKDGYGPNLEAYKRLIENGTQLIVTVDNGVSGLAPIAYAQEHGVDVVVTDHHELPAELPNAVAIVHPRHPEGQYPFGELCGVGVAFKVATALLEEIPYDKLDLAAIGTVCDIVPLVDENRTLVSLGLQQLQNTDRPGLVALCQSAGLEQATLDATNIGFGIGPRLNAIGRLGDATLGVQLLTTLDDEEAVEQAQFIEQQNKKRQGLVQEITATAMTIAETPENQASTTLVIAHEGWHEGVLGIVASHVVEQTGKPTLVLTIDPETGLAKGSGRSVTAFHLFKALDAHRELLVHFGGHHMAVGLTAKVDQLAMIQTAMNEYAQVNQLDLTGRQPLSVDLALTLADITPDLYQALQQLAPFGSDNPEPLIELSAPQLADVKQIGADQKHLKMMAVDQQQQLAVLAFNKGALMPDLTAAEDVKLVGSLSENTWRGQTTLQLMVKDLATSGQVILDQRSNRLTKQLFQATGDYVFFNDKMREQLQAYLPAGSQALLATDEQVATSQELIVVDEPADLTAFEQFYQQQQAARLSLIFYAKHSAYLEGMPTKQQFATFLVYLRKHPNIEKARLAELAAYLKLQLPLMIFMLQVFFDLGFVRIERGLITAELQPEKHALESAPSYQKRLAKIEMEKQLVYSTFTEVKDWLATLPAVANR
ncbi:single-stranded-DNA-specific exonuclease RecJ [Latilactobacillus sakei]|nr:single-stranded-DNA-specific exonuclease RecJ [Latilactobacillus sakei]AUX12191.1 single-stranded-DNA-specific exonuclease RecJ [Latilactobacillus sakei]